MNEDAKEFLKVLTIVGIGSAAAIGLCAWASNVSHEHELERIAKEDAFKEEAKDYLEDIMASINKAKYELSYGASRYTMKEVGKAISSELPKVVVERKDA